MMLLCLLSWPYLRRHLLRWILTVAGIVLGVGVFVAMHTANRSIFRAFDTTIDRIAGTTQLQVSAGEFGFDESILERVQSVPEVGVAVPVVEATVDTNIPGQGSILILGIDMTGDRSLRDYELKDADEAIIDDPLVFLAQPDSLMVTTEFAERNHLAVNSKVQLATIEGNREFTIRGLMSSAGMTRAFGGNLAVMDIYAAQQILGRGRRFDRIDVRAKERVTIDDGQAALKAALGPAFDVDPPSARGRHFEALLQSYSKAMMISSLFALMVGMFIIYNSFAIAVTHRRSEIGVLRALGATRHQIQTLFLVESIIAGTFGSILGASVGITAALVIAQWISSVLETAGGVAQRVTELEVDPTLIAAGVIAGITTSVVAAWIPARSAARVDPVQALQKGKYQILSAGENRMRVALAAALGATAIACLASGGWRGVFYAGYGLAVIVALLLSPLLSLALARAIRPLLKWLRPVEGALAADSLIQAPRRTSASVAALMLSLALVVAFAGMARASYDSIIDWMITTLNPDLFIMPSHSITVRTIRFPATMAPEVAAIP